jgi:hypothetical protein
VFTQLLDLAPNQAHDETKVSMNNDEAQKKDDAREDEAWVEYITEEQINDFWRQKAEERMRDAQLVKEGKLKWEDLSWAHILGWTNGKIDWSAVEAAIADDDEWGKSND